MADGDALIKHAQDWHTVVPALLVSNLDASVAEYTEGFGFTADVVEPGRAVVVRRDDCELLLRQFQEGDPLVTAELATPFGRGVELIIRVSDLDQIYNRLREQKHPVAVPMEMSQLADGDRQYTRNDFIVQDLDGYLIHFTDGGSGSRS